MPVVRSLLNQIFLHHSTDFPVSILFEHTHTTDKSVRQQPAGAYYNTINYRLDVLTIGVPAIHLHRGRYILLFDKNSRS